MINKKENDGNDGKEMSFLALESQRKDWKIFIVHWIFDMGRMKFCGLGFPRCF